MRYQPEKPELPLLIEQVIPARHHAAVRPRLRRLGLNAEGLERDLVAGANRRVHLDIVPAEAAHGGPHR